MDIQQQASTLEQMCANKEGAHALDQLQTMSREDQRAVIQQMKADAGAYGKVWVDAENDQLVFESAFSSGSKAGY